MNVVRERPRSGEYAEYYAGYVEHVPDGDVLEILEQQLDSSLTLLRGIDEQRAEQRYAPGKWTIKELVGHIVDIERVFAYRALVIARGDKTPLPGVEQDDLVAGAHFETRSLASLCTEFEHLRRSNLALFESLSSEVLMRRGEASGFEVTVRAIPFIMAGHERHHVQVLRERYL